MTTRRDALLRMGLLAAGGWVALSGDPLAGQEQEEKAGALPEPVAYTLPPLPYPYDALEPHIDEETMRLHHDRHHAGYVRGLNRALDALAQARREGRFELVKHWSREAAFHGSGHFLHTIFWQNMHPEGGGEPKDRTLARMLARDFGSFRAFRAHFAAAATKVEGSGWGILAYEPLGRRLTVLEAEKHQNLTQWGVVPLLVVDVWEHAYYLKYRNRRSEYVQAFFNVIRWDAVARRLHRALSAQA